MIIDIIGKMLCVCLIPMMFFLLTGIDRTDMHPLPKDAA